MAKGETYEEFVMQSAPQLTREVNAAIEAGRERRSVPRYEYPYEVATSAMLQRYAKYGVEFGVRRGECMRIGALDMQRDRGKAIFGGGLLLGERAAAERAAAERAAAERWSLSARERAAAASLRG